MTRLATNQRGATMIISLVVLVLLTLLGLTAIRVVTQQERAAAASYDRSLAFQAAESALREAEGVVEALKPQPTTCTAYTAGTANLKVCPAPAAGATMRWRDPAFTDWVAATAVGSGSLQVTPQYFAEYLGNNFPCGFDPADIPVCMRYRITARAGGSGRASVELQSVYATQ